ncbi:MAG: cobalamin biosynthesis protein CobW [Nocardioidaceae bacterium]|nr:cobalamin biosynthesis protein CobW [Nocardioidaceae bacterium]
MPTRPDRLCVWDGAGGQLSLGDVGAWTRPPDTRIVVTGTERDPSELITAFDTALLTDTELARGLATWKNRPDGLDAWLGVRPEAA